MINFMFKRDKTGKIDFSRATAQIWLPFRAKATCLLIRRSERKNEMKHKSREEKLAKISKCLYIDMLRLSTRT